MKLVFINQASKTARMPRAVILTLAKRIQKLFKRKTRKKIVSVVFVGPRVSKKLNKEYRNRNCATNVLSFSSPDGAELGDIIICPQKARQESKSMGVGFSWWVGYLFVHGLLHLLGYGHKSARQEERMEKIAKKILN